MSAKKTPSALISDLSESATRTFNFLGYNLFFFGSKHIKTYTDDDLLCAPFIRDVRYNPDLNHHLDCEVYGIATA